MVLNAKGGREVSVLSKANMKVVACYSAGKESYPGKLIATVPTVVEEKEEVWTASRLAEVLRTGLGGHGGAGSSGTGGGKGDEDEKKAEEWAQKVIKENPEEGKNKEKKM
jgi:hypothetical protein